MTRFGVPKIFGPSTTGGLCECGCGQQTTIVKNDDKAYGLKAGDYRRFASGHYHQMLRNQNPRHGHTVRLEKRRDEVRMILVQEVLASGGTKTLDEIRHTYTPDFRLQSCSVMLNSARVWYYHLEIPRILVRSKRVRPRQVLRPRYERAEIPYERETDIPMLVNKRGTIALDSPLRDGDPSPFIERFDYGGSNPLEILMLKEDLESEEYRERQERLESWNRWNEKREFFNLGKTATFLIEGHCGSP